MRRRRTHTRGPSALGAPTILVNAAGGNDPKVTVTPENPFEKIPPEALHANFDLNLIGGAFLPCQEFGPAMCKRGKGSIINIASVSAHIPLSRVVSYSAAKAAVSNFTQWLAVHLAPAGIRVNAIAPGFFLTEQLRFLALDAQGNWTPRYQKVLAQTPQGRLGDPAELQGAVLFLASRLSSFVTGVVLPVDGGFNANSGV